MARDFLPCAHLRLGAGAFEDVEDGDGLDQRLVGGAGGLEDGRGLGAGVEDEGEVALDGLEVGGVERRAGGAAGAGVGQRVEVEGEGGGGALHVEGGEDAGVELAEGGERGLVAEGEGGGAAGVEPGRRGALEDEGGGGADGGERGLGVGAGVPEVDRAAGAVRVARGGGAGAEAGGLERLLAGLAAGEGLADLEEGEVGKPRAWLRAAARRRPGRRSGRRWLISERDGVLEAHGVGAAAEEHGGGAVDEAVGDGLVVAEGGDAAAGLALAALGGGEDGLRHAGGAGERAALELGERGDAGDLLDEVGLALDVGAPGGGRGVAGRGG